MPTVTVLIPTYNGARFLLKSISSVLHQSFSDFELLIIDDGSTDNTADLVKSFKDSRIRYYRNSTNKGIVSSLNRGLDLARGKFIARMDADDILLGERFNAQSSFLDRNPEFGMIGTWYHTIDEQGNWLNSRKTQADSRILKLLLLFQNQFAHSSVMMRTEIARSLRYDRRYIFCEDHDLWIRIAENHKVSNIQDFHLAYRWYPSNSCSRNQRQLNINLLSLLSRELDKIGVVHSENELKMHAVICFGLAQKYYGRGDRLSSVNTWIEKVLSAQGISKEIDLSRIGDVKKMIVGL